MLLRVLNEFEIVGVFERGVPNKERIAIRFRQAINLVNYFLILGVPVGEQTAIPINQDVFWFGNEVVVPPTWVIVYTGPGQRKYTTMQGSNEPALVLHWGKTTTILNDTNIVPIIISTDGLLVGPHAGVLSLPKGG